MEVRAKKSLGQHFLVDLNIARKIAEAVSGGGTATANRLGEGCGVDENEGKSEYGTDTFQLSTGRMELGPSGSATPPVADQKPCDVLEIGGGMGVLTQFLLQRGDIDLQVAEIDAESVAYLKAHYPELDIVEGDFLKLNIQEMFPDGVRIIGNFPYNISSQILFKALDNRDLVPEVVGMLQREVAVRIAEPPGSRDYGILSVLLQAWYDIEYLFTVNEGVFDPPPKVKSAVIRLRRNGTQSLDCDEKMFVRVVKAAFGQRRKMLRNSLRAAFPQLAGEEHEMFTMRPEQLGVDDFIKLTQWIETKN